MRAAINKNNFADIVEHLEIVHKETAVAGENYLVYTITPEDDYQLRLSSKENEPTEEQLEAAAANKVERPTSSKKADHLTISTKRKVQSRSKTPENQQEISLNKVKLQKTEQTLQGAKLKCQFCGDEFVK